MEAARGRGWIIELGLACAAPLALVAFAPLGSRAFLPAAIGAAVLVFAYAVAGTIWGAGSARRWGFPLGGREPNQSLGTLDDEIASLLLLGLFFAAGIAPMLLMARLFDLPSILSPGLYLVWCFTQDFVFFALIQRNLQDRLPEPAAVGVSALLFGLSHYPMRELMLVTALAAVAWGAIYLRTRSFALLVLTHWASGLLTMQWASG